MDDLQASLILWRVPGIGPTRYQQLIEHFSSPSQVLDASLSQLQGTGLDESICQSIKEMPEDAADTDLKWLDTSDAHHVVTCHDPHYPSLLKNITDPPPVLFAQGDVALLSWPQLAIVGSRNPTRGGKENARNFAHHLAANGLGICSGMAEGIDAEAHEGALAANGVTVAVTGTGLDRVYPAKNRDLAHRIAEQGLIISEFPIGTPAQAKHFPRRNRIITGLSLGTLVVEAATRSGSLISARLSSEQGREVFAIPGSIHNPMAKGCHQLIRQGAKLIDTASDILEELGHLLPDALPKRPDEPMTTTEPLDKASASLLEMMGFDPISVDELAKISGLTVENISSMLLVMELHGHIHTLPGGKFCRHRPSSP